MLHALTLWQPWAWAIVHADKRVENRSWRPPPSAIGRVLAIHAGVRFHDEGADALRAHLGVSRLPPEASTQSAVVGVAFLTGVVRQSDSPYFSGPYGWTLDNVAAIRPIRCGGAQGLWALPADVLDELRANLAELEWRGYEATFGNSPK